MGFDNKKPKPPSGDKPTNKLSPTHKHTWWDSKGGKHEDSCRCDTGRDHTTPKES